MNLVLYWVLRSSLCLFGVQIAEAVEGSSGAKAGMFFVAVLK